MTERETDPAEDVSILLSFFRALCDEQRLQIAGLLATGPHTLSQLAEAISITPRNLPRPLQQLEDAGLVRIDHQSGSPRYELDVASLQAIKARVLARTPSQTPELTGDATDAERKILQSFLVDGRLTAIPSQRSRRLVVYQWLVERFDVGVEYSEAEVNERLAVYFPDYALLRRELVDEEFMDRDHGTYWRIERNGP